MNYVIIEIQKEFRKFLEEYHIYYKCNEYLIVKYNK